MLALAQFVSAPTARAQNGGSTLSGRAVNTVTKEGIPEVEISFCPASAPNPNAPTGPVFCDLPNALSVITDDTGSYSFRPPAGQYLVIAENKQGFIPSPGSLGLITIAGDTHRDFEMTPLAHLNGRVLDPEGNPAAGYVVAVDSACSGCTAMQVKVSNQDGEFSFTDLPPDGSFLVSVSPKTQDPKLDEKIVTTYYPSAVERDLAQGISMQGGDLFGYDIKLRTAPARSIRGVVLDDAGKPVPKALVSIVKPQTGIAIAIRGAAGPPPVEMPLAEPTETLEDGAFRFPAVIEGAWTLRVVGGQPAHVGSAVVKVGDSDVDGIEVRIAPAFDIALQTDWGEKLPAQFPANPVNLIPIDVPRPGPPPAGNLAPGEAAHFEGFAGNYLVAPSPLLPAGYYLSQALLDDRDVLGQVVEIGAADTLKLIFKTGGGSVRGTVEKGSRAMVVLMADPTPSGRLGYSARCDASGLFNAQEIPPGEYTAIAVGGSMDPTSAEFAALLNSSGKRVSVEAGSAAQVDLRLSGQ